MTGLELYDHWIAVTKQVASDNGIPEDKRLHANLLLRGMALVEQQRAAERRPRLMRAALQPARFVLAVRRQ